MTIKPTLSTFEHFPFYILLAVLSLSLGSTACGPVVIDNPLAPRSEIATIPTAYPIEITLHSSRGDQTNQELIDGSGATQVNLGPPHDPWVYNGLARTFEHAGFQVVEDTNGQAPLLIVEVRELRGERRTGFPNDLMGFVASFDVTLQIPTAQGPLSYERHFVGTDSYRGFSISIVDIERLVRDPLDEVFVEIVQETYSLLNDHR